MLSMSITAGAIAMTRRSTAAVVQVVHPLFDAPDTTNRFTGIAAAWPAACAAGVLNARIGAAASVCPAAMKAVIASIARTALLVIGSRAGQRSSPVRRNLFHV